jgi:hypothetical protein
MSISVLNCFLAQQNIPFLLGNISNVKKRATPPEKQSTMRKVFGMTKPSKAVVFILGCSYTRGYAKTSYGTI